MNKEINAKSFNLKVFLNTFIKKYGRHAVFAAILLVLFAYILVVLKISRLASAEPAPNQTTANPLVIPQVDQKAISHIQSLEQSNTQVHALFQQARNNPFSE